MQYQFALLTPAGAVARVMELVCDSDQHATSVAALLSGQGPIEIWRAEELVTTVGDQRSVAQT